MRGSFFIGASYICSLAAVLSGVAPGAVTFMAAFPSSALADERDAVWDFDEIIDLTTPSGYGDICELTGYGSQWYPFCSDLSRTKQEAGEIRDLVYTPDAVEFRRGDTYGIVSYDGEILSEDYPGAGGAVSDLPYRNTPWGISLDDRTVMTEDFRSSAEAPNLSIGSEAGYDFRYQVGDFFTDRDGVLHTGSVGYLIGTGYEFSDTSFGDEAWKEKVGRTGVVDRYDSEGMTNGCILSLPDDEGVNGCSKVDPDGRISYSLDYLYAGNYVNGFFRVLLHDPEKDPAGRRTYGLIDAETGSLITKHEYEDIGWFEDGYCPVMRDAHWTFINEEGEEVSESVFDDVSEVYKGKAWVSMQGRYRVLDLEAARERSGRPGVFYVE